MKNDTCGVAVIIIGRNEGERLKRSIQSASDVRHLVYVDSGSTDGSQYWAAENGAHVVELDLSKKFTAARARNAGFNALVEQEASIKYVQFIDGDCSLESHWLINGRAFLEEHADVAAVSGRRRERDPNRNLFHRLIDLEWDTPIGEVTECHGDVMMRVQAFQQVNGFDETMIAGEEPELSARLRKVDWRIWRIDEPMTVHDVNMSSWRQWWARSKRCGFAFTLGAFGNKKHKRRQLRSSIFWGGFLPLMTLLLSVLVSPLFLLLILLLSIAAYRSTLWQMKKGTPKRRAFEYGVLIALGKVPEFWGFVSWLWHRGLNRSAEIVEYKDVPSRTTNL